MSALAYAFYEIVKDFLRKMVNTLPGVRLILVGGIQINMKCPIEDMFLPLLLEIHEH